MKIKYAKAGSLDTMKALIKQGKYPEQLTVNDTFQDVLNKKYKKNVFPYITFGDSMLKSNIENGTITIVEKKKIEELKKHDIIALKIPLEDDKYEVKFRFFNEIKNNIIYVDKYIFINDTFRIKPSSNTHKLDFYVGAVIDIFNIEETKKMVLENTPTLELETTNKNGFFVANFKNLDYYTDDLDVTKSKKDIAFITDTLQGYGNSGKIAKENLLNKTKNLIEDNELNLENNVLSKTLAQLKYFF